MEDADVVEISPLSLPPSHFTRKRKQKQAVLPEIIDVDEHDFLSDVVILNENVRRKDKGKAIKDQKAVNLMKCEDVITLDTSLWNSHGKEDTFFNPNDVTLFDDLVPPQSHNYNASLHTGVEVPVSSLMGHVSNTGTLPNGGGVFSTSYESQLNTMNSQWSNFSQVGNKFFQPSQVNKQTFPMSSAGLEKQVVSENVSSMMYVPPHLWKSALTTPNMKTWTPQHGGITLNDSNFQVPGGIWHGHIPPIRQDPLSWSHTSTASKTAGSKGSVIPSSAQEQPGAPNAVIDEILSKLKLFKHFDIVEDYSDHHYKSSSSKQTEKKRVKRIQDEWKILEKDLPDTIYVRAYESRMDLLRAVIIGADGTPYHDGLFFFDIFFPKGYPSVPPKVHYHSGGLRLNPNLYACGKVCLSLLGTWTGSKKENWQPRLSNVMQVLLSIQALILNQNPYFNEPGYERSKGSAQGEIQSLQYNENTLLLSLKTMVYSMRKLPKHFEDLVKGHFHSRAKDIMVACKAYMSGAQVGCLVKGGIQDLEEGDKSCSQTFKNSLPEHVDMLKKAFADLGVKNL
ncbi:unnamed protein product [Linum trigynum]|uniref:E2 ubiquitin-conjugating enzyme n=1 Tax=Linum trigynum TaxID=586398 RepID=A0AAV2EK56_9ROSI